MLLHMIYSLDAFSSLFRQTLDHKACKSFTDNYNMEWTFRRSWIYDNYFGSFLHIRAMQALKLLYNTYMSGFIHNHSMLPNYK